MKTIEEISLDLWYEADDFKIIRASQGDNNSKYLKIYITDKGRRIWLSLDCDCYLYAKNSDGTSKLFKGEVNTDGTFTVLLPDWVIETVGIYECNAFIEEDNSRLSTVEHFKIEIGEPGGGEEDTDEDDPMEETLTGLVIRMKEVEEIVAELNEKQDSMVSADTDDYEHATEEDLAEDYFLIHDEDGETKKVSASELLDGGEL